jgi:hypothetical protein
MNYDRNLLDRFQDLFGTLKVRGSWANSVIFSFYFDVFAFCGVVFFSTLLLVVFTLQFIYIHDPVAFFQEL